MFYRLVFSASNSALERSASPPAPPTRSHPILLYFLCYSTTSSHRNGVLTTSHASVVNTSYQRHGSSARRTAGASFPALVMSASQHSILCYEIIVRISRKPDREDLSMPHIRWLVQGCDGSTLVLAECLLSLFSGNGIMMLCCPFG